MRVKKIIEFYKESNDLLRKSQSKELVGIQYLTPQLPRAITTKTYKVDINFFKKIIYFSLKFFKKKKNFNFFLNKDYKYLILSHFVSYDHLDFNNDFYFGSLASKLNKDKVLFVLIDHIGFKKRNVLKKIKGNYIILSRNLDFFSEISLILKTFLKIFYSSFYYKNLRFFNLKNILSSVDNQRISIQLKKILKNQNVQNIFFTYEGYPYEKLLCYEASKLDKNIKKIGYQLGVIRKFQYSLFSFINKKFDPEIIFTIGNYNKKILLSKLKNRLNIQNFGYFKNIEIYHKKSQISDLKKFKILVMPEGLVEEIKMFINFCSKNLNKNIEFTFRLHPIFLENKTIIEEINKTNGKIKISKRNLKSDIQNNNYLLYRGTSAIINGVNSGLTPIYLHKRDQVSIDPLYEVNKNYIINHDSELLNFMKNKINNKKLNKELFKIKKFCNLYYDKPKFNKLLKLLNKK